MRQVKTNNTTVEEIKKPRPIDIVLSILQRTCVFFTIFSLVVLTAAFAVESNAQYVSPARFLVLFPFALCISIVNLIFKAKSLHIALRLGIHFFVIAESFILLFRSGTNLKTHLSLLLIFLAIYIVIAAPILIVLRNKKKKLEKEEKYVPMFSKSNTSK